MVLDLFAFGYDNFSNKEATNIFEKAVIFKQKLKRVLMMDFDCQCEDKYLLISVKFNRKEFGHLQSFSEVKIFSANNPHLIEMTWQQSFKKTKIKSKNLTTRRKCG